MILSMFHMVFGWSAVKPKVVIDSSGVHIRTNLFLQLLTLFFYARKVHVDNRRRRVEYTTRFFWLPLFRNNVSFQDIAYLDYEHSEIPLGWTWRGHTTNSLEQFRVVAVLKRDKSKITLAKFTGHAAGMTGLEGVLWGDGLVDFSGDQDQKSNALVEFLVKSTGLPLGEPLKATELLQKSKFACSECNKPCLEHIKKCIYCGGAITQTRY